MTPIDALSFPYPGPRECRSLGNLLCEERETRVAGQYR
jgi:hypothetical protein